MQGFVIGLAALGAGLVVLQKKRSEIAVEQTKKTDPKLGGSGGGTVAHEDKHAPSTGGAYSSVPAFGAASSDDGTIGGNTSTSPSTPPARMSGIGAVTMETADPGCSGSDCETFNTPAPKQSEGTANENSTPPIIGGGAVAPSMPQKTYRQYLLGLTYGVGAGPVTPREESDNLQSVGPSVGAVW